MAARRPCSLATRLRWCCRERCNRIGASFSAPDPARVRLVVSHEEQAVTVLDRMKRHGVRALFVDLLRPYGWSGTQGDAEANTKHDPQQPLRSVHLRPLLTYCARF